MHAAELIVQYNKSHTRNNNQDANVLMYSRELSLNLLRLIFPPYFPILYLIIHF